MYFWYENCNKQKKKIMKAKQLLTNVVEVENNSSARVENLIKKNIKFLDRKISDIEREIEDKQEEIEKRLSSEVLIDESVVEVLYEGLLSLESNLMSYESFKDEYFNDEEI